MNKIGDRQLPDPTDSQVKLIEAIVDTILAAKQADPDADTAELEGEIDRLVYELYGLSEGEISIVKNC